MKILIKAEEVFSYKKAQREKNLCCIWFENTIMCAAEKRACDFVVDSYLELVAIGKRKNYCREECTGCEDCVEEEYREECIMTRVIEVQGYSDDCIYVTGGAFSEEFSRYESEGDYLAFSDGTLLHAVYDEDGIWRLKVCTKGTAFIEKIKGDVVRDINDIIRLKDEISWVVCGPDGHIAKTAEKKE